MAEDLTLHALQYCPTGGGSDYFRNHAINDECIYKPTSFQKLQTGFFSLNPVQAFSSQESIDCRQRVFDVFGKTPVPLPLCILFERNLDLFGRTFVFVWTEYCEYLFLEKTALAVIGWEHILGLALHKAANADDDQWEQNICFNVSELWHFMFQRYIKRWDDEA